MELTKILAARPEIEKATGQTMTSALVDQSTWEALAADPYVSDLMKEGQKPLHPLPQGWAGPRSPVFKFTIDGIDIWVEQ